MAALVLAAGASSAAGLAPLGATDADGLWVAETQNARRDARIRRNVLTVLGRLPKIDVRKLNVSVSRGIVTLRGPVQTAADRARAEEAAAAVPGVRLVINQLEIAGPDVRKTAF